MQTRQQEPILVPEGATINRRTGDGVFRNTEVFIKQAGTRRCVFNQVKPVATPPVEER